MPTQIFAYYYLPTQVFNVSKLTTFIISMNGNISFVPKT